METKNILNYLEWNIFVRPLPVHRPSDLRCNCTSKSWTRTGEDLVVRYWKKQVLHSPAVFCFNALFGLRNTGERPAVFRPVLWSYVPNVKNTSRSIHFHETVLCIKLSALILQEMKSIIVIYVWSIEIFQLEIWAGIRRASSEDGASDERNWLLFTTFSSV